MAENEKNPEILSMSGDEDPPIIVKIAGQEFRLKEDEYVEIIYPPREEDDVDPVPYGGRYFRELKGDQRRIAVNVYGDVNVELCRGGKDIAYRRRFIEQDDFFMPMLVPSQDGGFGNGDLTDENGKDIEQH